MSASAEAHTPADDPASIESVEALGNFLVRHRRLAVITGAGFSTASHIPDYRDHRGQWKRKPPVMFGDFMTDEAVRRRYWGRSLVGWQFFSRARPNAAHHALVELERRGQIELVVTQNVDSLHQQAGQRQLLPLHGTLEYTRCTACGAADERSEFQRRLIDTNPLFADLSAASAPDGDADLEHVAFDNFNIPDCRQCGGILKPDVVFYGENIPGERHRRAEAALAAAGALLVLGSSLMVYSAFRLAKKAFSSGFPIAALNMGATRADPLLQLKVAGPVETLLPQLVAGLPPAVNS